MTVAIAIGPILQADNVFQRNKNLSELYQKYRRRLQFFIYSRIHDKDEAEELAQQAFAEALRVYSGFRGESEMHTWLYAIANNLLRNHLSRSPRCRYEFVDDDMLNEHPHTDREPCDLLGDNEVVCLLNRYLQELPEDLRRTLLMVTIDELSYMEAAAALQIPVGTVRSRISRSRGILRSKLSAQGVHLDF